jgi:hypothetical protein
MLQWTPRCKDWEYDNETLAAKIAKLKKKQDGEVENPPATPVSLDLAKDVAALSQVSKAKCSVVVVSPISVLMARERKRNPSSRKLSSAQRRR